MKKVTIYTDGSCLGNPGPGGWAAILNYNGKEKIIHGHEENTTNNRMELMAAIEAIKLLKEPCIVELYTDSMYVKKGITEWIEKWKKNGFKNIKNMDLWLSLDHEAKKHKIFWYWVEAHSINEINNRVDKIAREAIKKNESSNIN